MNKHELEAIREGAPLIPGPPSTDSARADLTAGGSIYSETGRQLCQAIDILPDPAVIVGHDPHDPLKYANPIFNQLYDSADSKLAGSISNVLNVLRGVRKIRMHITNGPSLDLHVSPIPGGTNTLAIIYDISAYESEKKELERIHQEQISRINEAEDTRNHDTKNPFFATQLSAYAIRYNAKEALRLLREENPDLDEVSRLIADTEQTAVIIENSAKNGLAKIVEGIKTRNLSEELRKKDISITKVLKVVMNDYSGRIKIAGIEVKLQLPTEDSRLMGDANALASVLGNLLGNAIDALEGCKDKRVTINCEEKDGKIEIRVSDTGPGIPEQNRQKIFDNGFSTKISTKQSGSGVGLYQAKKIAELHNGDVTLEDTTAQGSTFVLTLPLLKQTN